MSGMTLRTFNRQRQKDCCLPLDVPNEVPAARRMLLRWEWFERPTFLSGIISGHHQAVRSLTFSRSAKGVFAFRASGPCQRWRPVETKSLSLQSLNWSCDCCNSSVPLRTFSLGNPQAESSPRCRDLPRSHQARHLLPAIAPSSLNAIWGCDVDCSATTCLQNRRNRKLISVGGRAGPLASVQCRSSLGERPAGPRPCAIAQNQVLRFHPTQKSSPRRANSSLIHTATIFLA